MAWHSRRRRSADAERVRASEANGHLLAAHAGSSRTPRTTQDPITIALGHAELLARDLAGRREQLDVHVVVGELTRLKRLSERLLVIAAAEDPEFVRPAPVALEQLPHGGVAALAPHGAPGLEDRTARRGHGARRPRAPRPGRGRLGGERRTAHRGGRRDQALSTARRSRRVRRRRGRRGYRGGHRACRTRPHLRSVPDRIGRWRGRGTGLGLALVRAVALGHGGEVLVRSAPGEGSRFELMLPTITPGWRRPGRGRRIRARGRPVREPEAVMRRRERARPRAACAHRARCPGEREAARRVPARPGSARA